MAFLEGYNIDQLSRLLTVSKWVLAACGLILLGVAVFNQWLASRISTLQQHEKTATEERLRTSQTELDQANAKGVELLAELSRFTAPRRLTDEQLALLRKSLPEGPKGKVVMASLKVESDAEKYAQQIADLLSETGFDVTKTKTIWLQLAVKGIYLCARDPANAPPHAVHIQKCFQAAGLRVRAHQDKKMYSDMNVPDDAVIFVVSGRE